MNLPASVSGIPGSGRCRTEISEECSVLLANNFAVCEKVKKDRFLFLPFQNKSHLQFRPLALILIAMPFKFCRGVFNLDDFDHGDKVGCLEQLLVGPVRHRATKCRSSAEQ